MKQVQFPNVADIEQSQNPSPHLFEHLLPDLPPQYDDYDGRQDGYDRHQAANQDPRIAVIHFVSGIIS